MIPRTKSDDCVMCKHFSQTGSPEVCKGCTNFYLNKWEPCQAQPVKFYTTENPLEDLRTLISGLREEGCKDADLLARLEYCLELLEGRHPEVFDPLKDMEGA